ncbi:MAG: hypothetical protein U0841_28170 [Chloroflexia bacterium]
MNRLLADPDLRARMAAAGRRRVEQLRLVRHRPPHARALRELRRES